MERSSRSSTTYLGITSSPVLAAPSAWGTAGDGHHPEYPLHDGRRAPCGSGCGGPPAHRSWPSGRGRRERGLRRPRLVAELRLSALRTLPAGASPRVQPRSSRPRGCSPPPSTASIPLHLSLLEDVPIGVGRQQKGAVREEALYVFERQALGQEERHGGMTEVVEPALRPRYLRDPQVLGPTALCWFSRTSSRASPSRVRARGQPSPDRRVVR